MVGLTVLQDPRMLGVQTGQLILLLASSQGCKESNNYLFTKILGISGTLYVGRMVLSKT
jgi:hypothetical protein